MENHATSSMVGKVVDSLLEVVKTQVGYIWNSTENIEILKNEAENLKLMRGNVQKHITSAKRKGDELFDGVQDWVDKTGVKISDAEEIIKQEAKAKKAKYFHWVTRYQYAKRATNMTSSLLQHQKTGKNFESCISVETPTPGPLDVYQNKDLEDLVTHNSALKDIIAALEDESIQITGIYGLGGVGKTTLAMEVVARVKNNLFADVAFTTVSQKVDVEKIQKTIGQATKRIMKGEKVLIILDDVWEKLNLEELCIPCGHNYMNCKILLTSRSEKVCQKMNAQSKICVNSLLREEAWILFTRVVGERLDTDSNLKSVAMKVVNECGGLPLLIQAVGNALKYESIESWNWALIQLQKHAPSDIDEEIRKSFTHLKLSYDYLKSEEAKSCFLLCSMYPEDYLIWLEDLVFYGVGLEKFEDLDSIEDARGRVQNAVNILTSSGLLLNSKWQGRTKMHDVVRDVALLIASQGNNKFLVKAGQGLTEWLPRHTSLESFKGIALMFNDIKKLPDYEVYLPHLQLFILCDNHQLSKISEEFIRCMKKLRVLDISWNNISSLPQSFELLTELRVLDLRNNKSLHEISIIGELRDLEILILNKTGVIEIPKEVAQLVKLRVLQVKDCVNLSCITQGVISSLCRLEWLSIEFVLNFKGASDCIVEVMSLSKLTYLDLTVPSIDDIPAQGQGFSCEKLKGFVIQIGEYSRNVGLEFFFMLRGRYLVLSRACLRIPLIEGSHPNISLYGIENLDKIMPDLYHGGFNNLEHLVLNYWPNVSCLVDDGTMCDGNRGDSEEKFFKELKTIEFWNLNNLEALWKCPDEYISLTNLVTLYIKSCDKLMRVFTRSGAQGLVNLKKLQIECCDGLEEVIWGGDGGDDESTNVFPSLAEIFLVNLRKLKSFYSGGSGNYCIIYPSLVDVRIQSCPSMNIWGLGIHETPILKTIVVNGNMPRLLDGSNAINDVVQGVYEPFLVT